MIFKHLTKDFSNRFMKNKDRAQRQAPYSVRMQYRLKVIQKQLQQDKDFASISCMSHQTAVAKAAFWE